MPIARDAYGHPVHPLCRKCGWAKGGCGSWDGRRCKCGHYEPPIQLIEDTVKTFLICPVRGVDPATSADTVKRLEAEGYSVHWPPRDTDQNDETGYRICSDNMAAIKAADVVHVIWDGKSQGCLFDVGVAFALGKRIVPVDLPAASEGKSFQNMIRHWAVATPKSLGACSES